MKNWSNIILVAQNDANPCVNIVKKSNDKIQYQKQSWSKDLALLLNAEHYVASKGTIWIAVSFLSKKLKTLFTFDQPQTHIRDHMNCVPQNQYKRIMRRWYYSRSQENEILHSNCTKWEFIKYEPQNDHSPYVWENTI